MQVCMPNSFVQQRLTQDDDVLLAHAMYKNPHQDSLYKNATEASNCHQDCLHKVVMRTIRCPLQVSLIKIRVRVPATSSNSDSSLEG